MVVKYFYGCFGAQRRIGEDGPESLWIEAGQIPQKRHSHRRFDPACVIDELTPAGHTVESMACGQHLPCLHVLPGKQAAGLAARITGAKMNLMYSLDLEMTKD